ncbi:MAG TPA: pantoate--beta-alanine ligase [Microthrixaceae bacterium]|nr:pantoate--beta-alanine ligase [Microthrixaceae bacterium]
MKTVTTVAELRSLLDDARRQQHRIGIVPTMGYLHAGHLSLIERAAAECDTVVTSIFVNPLQFAPGEDLEAYPRDPEGDSAKAREAGTDVLFVPEEAEMFPDGRAAVRTTVHVEGLSAAMEGASRRTHFGGVCTIVAKLFNVVGECRAYFGEKDYQQLVIVRQMARDLSFPVEVVGCPIVREPDGLAMSSRNVYLTPDERAEAPVLRRALLAGAAAIRDGMTDAAEVKELMASMIDAAPYARLDYVEVADPDTLEPQDVATTTSRLFGAVRFGRARLIDNVGVGG